MEKFDVDRFSRCFLLSVCLYHVGECYHGGIGAQSGAFGVVFVNAAALFLLSGAEFLGMILLVVYVGAVAVLFLFVVMMLDVDFASLKQGALQYAPIGALIGLILLVELILLFVSRSFTPQIAESLPEAESLIGAGEKQLHNTARLGNILYTDYVLYFQLAGLVLLVAMIGTIVLTLRHRDGVKRQSIAAQVAREPSSAIEIKKVESNKGLE